MTRLFFQSFSYDMVHELVVGGLLLYWGLLVLHIKVFPKRWMLQKKCTHLLQCFDFVQSRMFRLSAKSKHKHGVKRGFVKVDAQ